jgi:hypothetical protein
MNTLLARLSLIIPLSLAAALAGCDPLTAVDPDPNLPGSSGDAIVRGGACGGLLGRGCVKGSFCDYAPEALCGAADQTGTCTATPQACTEQYDPVCGCDDRTYGNACAANAAGVSVARKGACNPAPLPVDASADPTPKPDAGASERVCGGIAGLRCGAGQFCDYGATCSSIADGTGVCRAQSQLCPLIYAPVCGCDGNTYGNECSAHSKGVSIAANGECKAPPAVDAGTGKVCGGIAGLRCGAGEFCDYGALCSSIADGTGVCAPLSNACQEIYAPVCGCDDKTYSNECDAHSHGISVAAKRECGTPAPGGPACGGWSGHQCVKGEFCDFGAACSDILDASGVCRQLPQVCNDIYAPVCGCDGSTHGNECEAHAKGVPVSAKGACGKPTPDGRTCGGIAGLSCAANQFCNYEPPKGQGCDGSIADAAGVCESTPQACTLQYDPVCGCDGNTYGNACGAHSAGVSVAGKGECVPKQVSCDRRNLLCKRAEPVCPAGQVASIEGSCFGPCVNIEQCSCKEAAACPAPETYTCHMSRGVCGPFVR